MSTTREIMQQVLDGKITLDAAEKLLKGSRKLRGVQVSDTEAAAYDQFVATGNFRAFMQESCRQETADAQALLGRCTRAKHEVIEG